MKGTARVKISSKRDSEELDGDGYNISISLQNEDVSKNIESSATIGSSELASHSQQHIQRSSETGSGQQQNPSHQLGVKPSSSETGASHQEKPTLSTIANNPLSAPTQGEKGSQPNSNTSCSPISSHDSQSSNQTTVNPKQALNLNVLAEGISKKHLDSLTATLEVSNTSVCSSNIVSASFNGPKSNPGTVHPVPQTHPEINATIRYL